MKCLPGWKWIDIFCDVVSTVNIEFYIFRCEQFAFRHDNACVRTTFTVK
jgi:hypothetical protein